METWAGGSRSTLSCMWRSARLQRQSARCRLHARAQHRRTYSHRRNTMFRWDKYYFRYSLLINPKKGCTQDKREYRSQLGKNKFGHIEAVWVTSILIKGTMFPETQTLRLTLKINNGLITGWKWAVSPNWHGGFRERDTWPNVWATMTKGWYLLLPSPIYHNIKWSNCQMQCTKML